MYHVEQIYNAMLDKKALPVGKNKINQLFKQSQTALH